MTFNQLIKLLPKVVKYNLKIIFAGKFFWFLLAAFGFFAFFMFQSAWNRAEINEGLIYNILMFPCLLLTAGYWKYFLVFLTIGIKYGEYGYS